MYWGRLPVAAALLVVIAGTLPAQHKIWTLRYDSGQDYWNQVTAVAWCPDNAVVVTGFSYGSSNNLDIATIKMNSDDGEILWTQRWAASGTSIDDARDIAVDDSGNVFVTGVTAVGTPEGNNYVTIRYSPDGNEDWAVQYHSGDDDAVAVVPDGAGGCYVTGHSSYGGNYDYLTIYYDSLGAETWVSRVGGPANGTDRARAMVTDPTGSYLYVTGSGYAGTTGMDYYTLKLDRATGDTLWGRTYDGTAASPAHDFAFAIAKDNATPQNVYVTGAAEMPAGPTDWGYQFLTHKLEVTNLEQRWGSGGATWGDTLEDAFGYDVAWADGRVYVTGHDSGAAGRRTAAGAAQFSVAPNPMTGSGVLRYVLPRAARLDAAIIDAAGRRVRTVAAGRLVSGSGALPLDTRGLARGVYLLRVSAPGFEPRSLKIVIE